MAEKLKCLITGFNKKCTRCKYFKNREARQRFDRCTNQEITKEILSGIYYCSECEPKDGDTNG